MRSKFPICVLILLMIISACKQQEIAVPEQVKDLSGEWRIVKAVRNGVDITTLTDFTQFRLSFNKENQYSIEHPLPFVVNKNGSYALDDPKYPLRITFSQTGTDAPVSSSFAYPVVAGKRNLVFTFSPGCTSNTYLYTLEKVAP
ncbi:DUF5004 domain-containing protein [Chitinophaga sp. S165]|uniref:DUF5004 domain-containing protein n=1 Tax=Chitinophaga sp. S165 TaxID=2135462 RepID=UPI000D71D06D|nr:DUF5004 domain-containing protein [Chitinophaga sp. S165]PWV49113.1 uncharacterized protein DUF5004 [Chitinophaga sp. S165]